MIEIDLLTFIETQVAAAGYGYPIEVPEDATLPSWAYQLIDDQQVLAHNGGTHFHEANIQITMIAPETSTLSAYLNAKNIAQSVRNALDGYKGTWTSTRVDYCKTVQSDEWADLHKLPAIKFDVTIHYVLL